MSGDIPRSAGNDTKAVGGTLRSTAVRFTLILGIVAIAVFLSRRVVEWPKVADAIVGLTLGDWLLLVGVASARLAIEPLLLMAVTPRLSWPRGLVGFIAPAAAASIVPGPTDLAARYAMFRSWEYTGSETSASVMLVFLFTTFTKVSLPPIAAAILLLFGREARRMVSVASIALGVLAAAAVTIALLLRSEQTARRIGGAIGTAAHRVARWFRIKEPESLATDLADRAAHFRDKTGHLIRSRSRYAWPAAALGQAAMFAILLVSIRVVGIGPDRLDWVAIFAPFAFVQLLTSMPITPSGIGVTEAAYVALLAVGSTSDLVDEVTAAALISRIFSWVIIIPLGGIAWLWWSRNSTSVSREVEGTQH